MPGQPGLPNLAAMRGRRKGGAPAPKNETPSGMAAHAAAFLENLAARQYSTASIDAHRWALRQFTAWVAEEHPDRSAEEFTRADLEDYQLFLHRYRSPRGGRPLAINTQLARLGCLRRFFAWLCRAGVIPANPAADLDLPRKQARQLPKALSAEEIRLMLAIPDTTDPFGLRDRAILELFYATGIRRTEMANLDLGDYDPLSQTLHIRWGKGGKSRMLPAGNQRRRFRFPCRRRTGNRIGKYERFHPSCRAARHPGGGVTAEWPTESARRRTASRKRPEITPQAANQSGGRKFT